MPTTRKRTKSSVVVQYAVPRRGVPGAALLRKWARCASSSAVTLRIVGGLTTEEIARAFLVPVATVQQRIVRAKKTLAAANVPFAVPDPEEYAERLGSVLSVLYLIFNEGYLPAAGEEWIRPDVSAEALRLDARQHATAVALHVHRNTLRYRLSQISRLLETDLDSLDTLVSCNLAFRMYDAAGR